VQIHVLMHSIILMGTSSSNSIITVSSFYMLESPVHSSKSLDSECRFLHQCLCHLATGKVVWWSQWALLLSAVEPVIWLDLRAEEIREPLQTAQQCDSILAYGARDSSTGLEDMGRNNEVRQGKTVASSCWEWPFLNSQWESSSLRPRSQMKMLT
jgi:hypothetical protein